MEYDYGVILCDVRQRACVLQGEGLLSCWTDEGHRRLAGLDAANERRRGTGIRAQGGRGEPRMR
ncbi:hypothetical protein SPI_04205 [Niveomyces insectorum RCEF 264]|uniref:Uncharacterized protein n=1 Tax=Niveomyces insectorum RCEF 264 TaxID=1081102 RepID=A0A167VIQ0_9HYPO|nr:hypothetical protein SPI_04205 [Niveomyces insectorum RCEF 264]